MYENTKFTSSEQCFQFVRARSNNELGKAHRIIISSDAFACKRIANQIEDTTDWLAEQESTMTDIIRLKFEQNPHLVELLLATGTQKLQEATTSVVWGIGAGIRSKTARENTADGKNLLGKILMQMRTDLTANLKPPHISDTALIESTDTASGAANT